MQRLEVSGEASNG